MKVYIDMTFSVCFSGLPGFKVTVAKRAHRSEAQVNIGWSELKDETGSKSQSHPFSAGQVS